MASENANKSGSGGIKTYKCPQCETPNKAPTFFQKIERSMPQSILGAVVTTIIGALWLPAGAAVATALAAYQYIDGVAIKCGNCGHEFKIE